jgi:hypothetical protein
MEYYPWRSTSGRGRSIEAGGVVDLSRLPVTIDPFRFSFFSRWRFSFSFSFCLSPFSSLLRFSSQRLLCSSSTSSPFLFVLPFPSSGTLRPRFRHRARRGGRMPALKAALVKRLLSAERVLECRRRSSRSCWTIWACSSGVWDIRRKRRIEILNDRFSAGQRTLPTYDALVLMYSCRWRDLVSLPHRREKNCQREDH